MEFIHVTREGTFSSDQGYLNQAASFFAAGSRCMAPIFSAPRVMSAAVTPGIVCYAFSVELYLKLLRLLATGKTKKDHKLEDIYVDLPEEFRVRLAKIYGKDTFEADLAAVSTAFVDWRYEHEHEPLSINPQILIRIGETCHLLVREIKPALTAAYDRKQRDA